MTLPRTQAQTEAQTALDEVTAAANARFIAAADIQIQEAILQGEFWISATTTDDIDPETVFRHYADLGYGVSFPDYPTNLSLQPAELFGAYWINFWSNGGFIPRLLKKPYRLLISWHTPVPFYPFP
jgi:hypothetical protein